MGPLRRPVFSQGSAWLPPWLVSSPLHSNVQCFDTPSMLAASSKDEELTLTSNTKTATSSVLRDLTNRAHDMLCLSEEPLTGSLAYEPGQGVDCLSLQVPNDTLHSQSPKALVLELSLSPRESEMESSFKCDKKLDREKTILQDGLVLDMQDQIIDMDEHEKEGNVPNPCGLMASNGTQPTKTYIQPARKDSPCRGDGQVLNSRILDEQHTAGSAENHTLARKCGKKVKLSTSNSSNKAVQAAVGLTVATAETIVIADIMNSCVWFHDFGPKAILDAALSLKRGREFCGLDDFTLDCMADESWCDGEWNEGLDDCLLEEEYLTNRPGAAMDTQYDGACGDVDVTPRCERPENDTFPTEGEGTPKVHNDYSIKKSGDQRLPSNDSAAEVHVATCSKLPSSDQLCKKSSSSLLPGQSGRAQQHMASKGSFNSRWIGGWTGVEHRLGQATEPNVRLAGTCDEFLLLETSDLSEYGDELAAAETLQRGLSRPQKVSLSFHTSVPSLNNGEDHHGQAITAGSCAEILVTMSQASVKCSSSFLQEPICSFVPCSITPNIAHTKLPPNTNHAVEVLKEEGGWINEAIEGGDMLHEGIQIDTEDTDQKLPYNGIKRKELNSLRCYSTMPFSPLLEAVRLMNDEQECLTTSNKDTSLQKKTQSTNDASPQRKTQSTNDASPQRKTISSIGTSKDQSKRKFQDSGLQDSPPLTWHRGKKRRLRACRVIESALIHDTEANCLDEILTDHRPIITADIAFREGASKDLKDHARSHTQPQRDIAKLSLNQPKEMIGGDTTSRGYKLRERTCTMELFKGLLFLLTGFPSNQKALYEDVSRKIEDHGGKVLASIPVFSTQKCKKTYKQVSCCPIIVAPQKVRTVKYLYGCAIGSLFVKPKWVDDCISAKALFSERKDGDKGNNRDLLLQLEGKDKAPLFTGVEVFFHGQHGYCSKLSSLVQHGGGKILRSLKALARGKNASQTLVQIIVTEHLSGIPGGLKQTATKLALPVVSGDWIIESLLEGRVLPLPAVARASSDYCNAASNQHVTSRSRSEKGISLTGNISAKSKLLNQHRPCSVKAHDATMHKPKRQYGNGHFATLLGKSMGTPILSRSSTSFEFLKPRNLKTASSMATLQKLYHRSICIDGVIYSAGDIVEVHPYTEEEKETYIAQIESFYASCRKGVKTRAPQGEHQKLVKPCFMWCRWFYRPSDTGFPCVGTDRELYLSQHFDDKVPVMSIMKKVSVLLVVDGRKYKNEDEIGWKGLSQKATYSGESAEYICRFFYDHKKESLHQLKASLTL